MLGIIDYGVGNIFSLASSLKYLGVDSVISSDVAELSRADRLILPGVGAFADARKKLEKNNLDAFIVKAAGDGIPVLGICLGMQLLFDASSEYGAHKGLGLICGKVESLTGVVDGLKVPETGWNRLIIKQSSDILKFTENGEYVYYVHSYYVSAENPAVRAYSEYGVNVGGAVQYKNIYGTQFHPEKSGESGLRILKAFCEV